MENPEDHSLFSIVVSGHLNPAIHHPAWYEQIGILTRDQVLESAKGENFICIPQVAQFVSGPLTITCVPGRWDVKTPRLDQLERILDIATRTHRALEHTPVSAFGFNFDIVEEADADEVARYFGSTLQELVGLQGSWSATDLHFRSGTDHETVNVVIAPVARTPKAIAVRNNFHYPIQPGDPETWAKFDLGALLQKRFSGDFERARANVAAVKTAMKRRRGTNGS